MYRIFVVSRVPGGETLLRLLEPQSDYWSTLMLFVISWATGIAATYAIVAWALRSKVLP